jgi:hypothetical protein
VVAVAKDLAETESAVAPLDEIEEIRLGVLEATIERNLIGFRTVGKALQEIHDKRLYRETHPDFVTYLRERWEMSSSRGYQMLEAAKVADQLDAALDEPLAKPKESYMRALAPLAKKKPEQLKEAVETVQAKGKPTAKDLADEVNRRLGHAKVSTKVETKGWQQLALFNEEDERQEWEAAASDRGYTLEEFVRACVQAELAKGANDD